MGYKVIYKCRCMDAEASTTVRSRGSSEDIAEWMNEVVAPALSRDHFARSPLCRATKMEYAKLPIDESADGIGMKPPKLN